MKYKPCALLLLLCTAVSTLCQATWWQTDPIRTSITFFALQEKQLFNGGFSDFIVEAHFEPRAPASSYFKVVINTDTVNTQSSERDEVLRSDQFFHTGRWPEALFRTTQIIPLGGNRYLALAKLRIRNREKTLLFPFQLGIHNTGEREELIGTGGLLINRFDFDLAQGEWQDTDVIGELVLIKVTLTASKSLKEQAK